MDNEEILQIALQTIARRVKKLNEQEDLDAQEDKLLIEYSKILLAVVKAPEAKNRSDEADYSTLTTEELEQRARAILEARNLDKKEEK